MSRTDPPHFQTGQGPFRAFNDWQEDPWAEPEDKARRKRERIARWIGSLSDRDWARLRERCDQVLAGRNFARFMDLDAPIDVGVIRPDEKHMPNGDRFGTLKTCILMAWPKTKHPPSA